MWTVTLISQSSPLTTSLSSPFPNNCKICSQLHVSTRLIFAFGLLLTRRLHYSVYRTTAPEHFRSNFKIVCFKQPVIVTAGCMQRIWCSVITRSGTALSVTWRKPMKNKLNQMLHHQMLWYSVSTVQKRIYLFNEHRSHQNVKFKGFARDWPEVITPPPTHHPSPLLQCIQLTWVAQVRCHSWLTYELHISFNVTLRE